MYIESSSTKRFDQTKMEEKKKENKNFARAYLNCVSYVVVRKVLRQQNKSFMKS